MAKFKNIGISKTTPFLEVYMKRILMFLSIVIITGLLTYKLGHYALWDDEALVSLTAKVVQQTGDTGIILDEGKNIIAYRNGLLAHNMHDRSTPPLQTYIIAASFLLFGDANAWAARIPFAIFGVLSATLVLYAAYKIRAPWLYIFTIGFGFIGNASFILFSRQARYYSICMFFTILVGICYLFRDKDRRLVYVMPIASILLYFSNIMAFMALFIVMFLDYIVLDRKRSPISLRHWLILVVPLALVCIPAAFVWNPLLTGNAEMQAMNTRLDRFMIWLWQWRDINMCEFVSAGVLLAAIAFGIYTKDRLLFRLLLGITIYMTFIALVTPQVRAHTQVADVRYLVCLIPFFIILSAVLIVRISKHRWQIAVPLALVVSLTNIASGRWLTGEPVHSSTVKILLEMSLNPKDPYTEASRWLNDNAPTKASVWVVPDYSAYPLMFHAPRQQYAWQLSYPPDPQFQGVPEIFYMGRIAPDYIIAFGPYVAQAAKILRTQQRVDFSYRRVTALDCFWKDTYRPELFWRTFGAVKDYDPSRDGIFIFERIAVP